MQQPVIEECAGLLPVAGYHHEQRACFRSRRRDFHRVFQVFRKVLIEKPVASFAQPRLAPHFINLQVKLCLLVGGFCHSIHFAFPFLIGFFNPAACHTKPGFTVKTNGTR